MARAGMAVSSRGTVRPIPSCLTLYKSERPTCRYDASRTESFQILLYHANRPGPGSRTLTFTCQRLSQQTCDIDHAQVYRTPGNRNGSESVPTTLMTSNPCWEVTR